MRRHVSILAVLVFLVISSSVLIAGEKDDGTITCSVCGYMVPGKDASVAELDGKTYHFCEPGCKAYFLQNPEIVTSGMTIDPVCGMTVAVSKAISTVHNNQRLHFCSESCREGYLKDPARYELNYDVVGGEVKPVREMKHSMEFEGRTYYFASEENLNKFKQNSDAYIYAECPIGGHVFLRKNATGSMKYDGKTYYFGCKGCEGQFKADPAKCAAGGGKCTHTGCPAKAAQIGCKKAAAKDCPAAKAKGGCPFSKDKNTPKKTSEKKCDEKSKHCPI